MSKKLERNAGDILSASRGTPRLSKDMSGIVNYMAADR